VQKTEKSERVRTRPQALFEQNRTDQFIKKLLAWYASNARDLPWRRTRDPYAIWIAEVMLQQTQVKTVLSFWTRWMRALPTIRELANASPATVLKLWEGLGYYARARNLHAAAKIIVREHQGQLPQTFAEVLALPGVGRYTAGAICSIAFNQPTPILDGNVIRVLTRIYAIHGRPREKQTNSLLWSLAERLVEAASRLPSRKSRSCADVNQALMELGALLCIPNQPKCDKCPMSQLCLAHRQGRTREIPNLAQRVRTTARRFFVVIAEARSRFLVRQRPRGGLNAELWEFPNLEISPEPAEPMCSARKLLGKKILSIKPLGVIRHSITRYRVTLEIFLAKLPGQRITPDPRHRWCTRSALEQLPFSGAHRRIIDQFASDLAGGLDLEPVPIAGAE
jgi:A/G-specific adenine glycosylase